MIYRMAPPLHHQIPTIIFLHQAIGHHITIESNLNSPTFFSLNRRCPPRVSTSYLISGKCLQSPSTAICPSPVLQICMYKMIDSTPYGNIWWESSTIRYNSANDPPTNEAPSAWKIAEYDAGSMILASSYGISLLIEALTRSLITHLIKNIILRVSIGFTICFLAIGAGEKQ